MSFLSHYSSIYLTPQTFGMHSLLYIRINQNALKRGIEALDVYATTPSVHLLVWEKLRDNNAYKLNGNEDNVTQIPPQSIHRCVVLSREGKQ